MTGHGGSLLVPSLSARMEARLATAGSDNSARVWKLHLSPGGAIGRVATHPQRARWRAASRRLLPGLTAVTFSPDGTKLATGGWMEWPGMGYSDRKGSAFRAGSPDGRGITRIVFSPDGRLLATGTDKSPTGQVHWQKFGMRLAAGRSLLFPGTAERAHLGSRLRPDGNRVATGGWGGR